MRSPRHIWRLPVNDNTAANLIWLVTGLHCHAETLKAIESRETKRLRKRAFRLAKRARSAEDLVQAGQVDFLSSPMSHLFYSNDDYHAVLKTVVHAVIEITMPFLADCLFLWPAAFLGVLVDQGEAIDQEYVVIGIIAPESAKVMM